MKPIVVANWKMNPPTLRDAKKLFEATRRVAERAKGVRIVVAPPAVFIRELAAGYRGTRIAFACQHAHFAEQGAYTGELSMAQVRDAGAAYVIVGHAERRAAGETNDDTRKKISAALEHRLTPIFCVGENVRTSDGAHFAFVREQIVTGLADIPPGKLTKITFAYEPVWAIGAEKPMEPRDMQEMSIFIRKTLVERVHESGMNVNVLYGGAVNRYHAASMLRDGGVEGLLVGRASIDAEQFGALIGALEDA